MSPLDAIRAVMASHVHGSAYTVLATWCTFLGADLVAWPSAPRLASATGMTDRGVRNALRALREEGVLVTVGRTQAGGIKDRLDLEALAAVEPRKKQRRKPPRKRVQGPETSGTRFSPRNAIPDPPECYSDEVAMKGPDEEAISPQPPEGGVLTLPVQASEPPPKARPPAWATRAAKGRSITAPALADSMVQLLSELKQAEVNPSRCATDAKAVLSLWRALERPEWASFAEDLALVAKAARDCPDRLFGRDIRAEGWDDGTDRSRSVKTLCVQSSFGDRLDAARRWMSRGGSGPAPPGPRLSIAERRAIDEARIAKQRQERRRRP